MERGDRECILANQESGDATERSVFEKDTAPSVILKVKAVMLPDVPCSKRKPVDLPPLFVQSLMSTKIKSSHFRTNMANVCPIVEKDAKRGVNGLNIKPFLFARAEVEICRLSCDAEDDIDSN